MIDDLFQLRESDCPSELALDQLHLGELIAKEAQTLQTHVDGCDDCMGRMALRAEGPAAFSGMNPDKMVAAIHTRTAGTEAIAEPSASLWTRIAALFTVPRLVGAAGFALALALVFMGTRPGEKGQPGGTPGPTEPGIRAKGSVKLMVAVERDGARVELVSKDLVYPTDLMELRLEVEAPGHVMIVGDDGSAELQSAHPFGGSQSVAVTKAGRVVAPEPLQLTDAGRRQRLFGVWCPHAFGLADVSRQEDGTLAVPAGCAAAGFEVTTSATP